MRKILLSILSLSMFVSVFCIGEIKAKKKIDYSNAVVYTIDDNGELVESDESVEFLLSMLESSDTSTYVIPGPEYTATRITDIKNTTVDRSSSHTLIKNLVEVSVDALWIKFGGSLINAITGIFLAETLFKDLTNYVCSSISNAITSNITTKAYLTSYMYKKWSDYYDCYLIYFCCFEYSDSERTQVKNVYHEQVTSTNVKLGM